MTHSGKDLDDMPQALQPPDSQKMQDSIANLLTAAGFATDHEQLKETPQRVTECWNNDLLDGYRLSPANILSECYPTEDDGLVVVHNIDCHGVCPHHLLPFFGKVHLAYVPNQAIVGFSKLGELVRCLTHRLTLQETATHQIAEALMEHLNAKGAGCVMLARQMCMSLRHPDQRKSEVLTSCFLGTLKHRAEVHQLLHQPPR